MNYAKRVLFAVIAGTVLSACGSGDSGTADGKGDSSARATDRAAAAAPRDACGLLTEAEVGAMAGEPVSARRGDGGRTYSECAWFGARTQTPYLELTVYWRGGREAWEAQRMGYAMARSMMQGAESVEIDSIVRPGPVPALGDSAIYADLMPAIVLDDDVLLEMTMFHMPDAARKFRSLAETILARVKS
jgi:hypothetical protein